MLKRLLYIETFWKSVGKNVDERCCRDVLKRVLWRGAVKKRCKDFAKRCCRGVGQVL